MKEIQGRDKKINKLTYCEDGSLRLSFHPTKNLCTRFQFFWKFTKSETNVEGINVGSSNTSSEFDHNKTINSYLKFQIHNLLPRAISSASFNPRIVGRRWT